MLRRLHPGTPTGTSASSCKAALMVLVVRPAVEATAARAVAATDQLAEAVKAVPEAAATDQLVAAVRGGREAAATVPRQAALVRAQAAA